MNIACKKFVNLFVKFYTVKPSTHFPIRIIALIILGVSVLLLKGCGELGYSVDVESEHDSSSMPTDLWLLDAQEHVQEADTKRDNYTLKAEVNEQGVAARIYFNDDIQIYKLSVADSMGVLNNYYFTEGILAYSTHHSQASKGVNWLVAYAQNKPYAACNNCESDSEKRNENASEAPIKESELRDVIRLVDLLEERENSHFYDKRIEGPKEIISDQLTSGTTERIYAVNAIRGEKLRVQLSSSSEYIFFTVLPNNGSNMEHKYWEGSATITGDLIIKVFTVDHIASQAFELIIEKL